MHVWATKKSNKPCYQENPKAPVSFPFLITKKKKKIIIQKGKNNYPTPTRQHPPNFVAQNKTLFLFSHDSTTPPLHLTKLQKSICVFSQKQSFTTLQLTWLVSSLTSVTYALIVTIFYIFRGSR